MSNTNIVTIGIDLGKNTFHIVGFDAAGAITLRKKRSRHQLDQSFANIGPCLIGMEACAGAHHLGRKLEKLGHQVRLLPAQYVKPYLKGHKNDFRDAEAIAEATQRPDHALRTIEVGRTTRFAGAPPSSQPIGDAENRGHQSNPGLFT